MRKRKLTTVLTGTLCLGLLTSCTLKLDELLGNIIDSIDINALIENLDLESILADVIDNFSLEDIAGITEEQAQTYIQSFNPSSKYDDVNTMTLSSSTVENGSTTESTTLELDDTLSSLTLSYSSTVNGTTERVSLSNNEDGLYVISENGDSKEYAQEDAQSYVSKFKEDIIDKYAYSEENYFFDLIQNGENSYYSLSNYIRFQGSYTSTDDDETLTVYDSAFTLEGLFVAGVIYKYVDNSVVYQYSAHIDYNDSVSQVTDLL